MINIYKFANKQYIYKKKYYYYKVKKRKKR